MNNIKCNGWIDFFHNGCELPPHRIIDFDESKHISCNVQEYDFIDGMEFLDDVDACCFMNYDGSIAEVLVNGYISNLGLAHKGLASGDFMVTDEIWEMICNKFEVVVNWANK